MPPRLAPSPWLLDLLWPETCRRCGARRDEVPWSPAGPPVRGLRARDRPHLCAACARALARGPVLRREGEPSLPLAGGTRTGAELTRLVGELKYHGVRGLAWPLARLAALALPALLAEAGPADLLAPVPLHRSRRRRRGFNQAALLARLLALRLELPCREDLLRRHRATGQQARIAAADPRRALNVAGSFLAAPAPAGPAPRIGLVDDLITSGATARAAAAALAAAGWRPVWAVAAGAVAGRGTGLTAGGAGPSMCSAFLDGPSAYRSRRSSGDGSREGDAAMRKKLGLTQLDPSGRKVLMRVDFNVPLDRDRRVSDDTRIRAALPSIRRVLEGGGSLVLMSHLGRPKGEPDPALSLRPVADRLSELVEAPVRFAGDSVGEEAREQARKLRMGEILLLENLRFSPGEKKNDPEFAQALARLGDAYVDDAFGSAHRAHASTVGVTAHFERRYAGLLMERELEALGSLLGEPERPFVAVLGGAKVQGKVDVITSLLDRVDTLLIGGGMVFTFFRVHGLEVGDSLVDEASLDVVRDINEKAREARAELLLPVDCLVARDFSERAERQTVLVTDIPAGWQGLDIGPRTIARFREVLAAARSIFWNGPMGVFEMPAFAVGTEAVGRAVVAAGRAGAFTVAGGGDTVAALNRAGLADGIGHVSTGGGASLEFMAGRELPGVAALTDA